MAIVLRLIQPLYFRNERTVETTQRLSVRDIQLVSLGHRCPRYPVPFGFSRPHNRTTKFFVGTAAFEYARNDPALTPFRGIYSTCDHRLPTFVSFQLGKSVGLTHRLRSAYDCRLQEALASVRADRSATAWFDPRHSFAFRSFFSFNRLTI